MKFSAVLLSSLVCGVASFSSPPLFGARCTTELDMSPSDYGAQYPSTAQSKTALLYQPEHFDRAVECATTVGECDINELQNLADGKYLLYNF